MALEHLRMFRTAGATLHQKDLFSSLWVHGGWAQTQNRAGAFPFRGFRLGGWHFDSLSQKIIANTVDRFRKKLTFRTFKWPRPQQEVSSESNEWLQEASDSIVGADKEYHKMICSD